MGTSSFFTYEQVLFHPLHEEKNPGVRGIKAPKRNQDFFAGLGESGRRTHKRNVSIGAPSGNELFYKTWKMAEFQASAVYPSSASAT